MRAAKKISLVLTMALLCSLLPDGRLTLAAEESTSSASAGGADTAEEAPDTETLEIRTAEEFLEFVANCYIDGWSGNRRVVLKEDIDLSEEECPMIPVFAGTFDGEGHTISGFYSENNEYLAGLFRYIEADGVVKNLNLKGSVTGTEEEAYLGGLCGVNYGTIRNCSFQGIVSGRNKVGAIAGANESSGTISNCTVKGRITGYYMTGGVVGANYGTVNSCKNFSKINNDSEWVEEDDEIGVGIFLSINISEDQAELYSGVDTGGIAGYSSGTISRCVNYGRIGYEHTGYNIGGIAGRQVGNVLLCTNDGSVYGKKDVGGIVGQMEPYIEVSEAESLRNAVNKLHDLIDKTLDDVQKEKDVVKTDFDALTTYSENALNVGNAMADQIADFADTNMEQVRILEERKDHVTDSLPGIVDNVSSAQDSYGKVGDSLREAAGGLIDGVSGGDLSQTTENLSKAADHLHDVSDSLKAAAGGARDVVDYVNSQPDVQFVALDEQFHNNQENLHTQLIGVSDSLQRLSENASAYSKVVNEDLRAVNDQLNVVFNLLADHLSDYGDFSVEEMYEEVSDEDIESITIGRADSCTNTGVVKGDIHIGGIAGAMSIDDEDPEDNAAEHIKYEVGRHFITNCAVVDCVNDGYVSAKKDGAGGIVGYMEHGIVSGSEGYGEVESTEGGYVGGICGESQTVLRQCYALCSVSGGRNVGGIAGYADTLKDCRAIVNLESSGSSRGSIAGQIASYENLWKNGGEEAKVCRNYYVGDEVHGIDDVSYVGAAEPIEYADLLAEEGLPSEFRHLKVMYRVEDTFLGSQEVAYGESLADLKYPKIPEREGCYGVWPDYSDQVMKGNLVIEGEYKDNVTVVESDQRALLQSGKELELEDRPLALVEQTFTEDTVLKVDIQDVEPPQNVSGRENMVYHISLENGGVAPGEVFAVRILNPYKNAEVWGFLNGEWTKLEKKERGQYLQVDMTGEEAVYCVAEAGIPPVAIAAAAVAVAAVLLLLVIGKAVRGKKAHNKSKAEKKEP